MTGSDKTAEQRIDELQRLIDNTRDEFDDKLTSLHTELTLLREELNAAGSADDTDKMAAESVAVQTSQIQTVELEAEHDQTQDNSETAVEALTEQVTSDDSWRTSATTHIKTENHNTEVVQRFNLFRNEFFLTIISFLLNSFALVISPVQSLLVKFVKLYQHYKEQGKAPVFLMTVAGLITLTFGFAYLLQYSFHTYFNDTLKAISGFIIGAGIIGAGALLARKQTDFSEYAASIVALGVIFNYLTAYFIGPYYGIVSTGFAFVVLMIVTVVAFALAIIFETKVVAFITLVAGVLMPFISGNNESIGLIFLLYLFALSSANLYLSFKINWPTLAQITIVLSLSSIEYIGISQAVNPLVTIVVLTAFFYSYAYFWSFNGLQIKEKISRYDLTFIVSNLFYFLYAMLQLSISNTLIASVFLLHALLLGGIVVSLRLMSTRLAPVYFLMMALLLATSVFVLAPLDVGSVIWALEGLVLVFVGFYYKHKLIRAEGYAVYVIAMFVLLWQLLSAPNILSSDIMVWYWFTLLAFGVLSFAAYRLLFYFKAQANRYELKALTVQNEVYTLWGALSFSYAIAVVMPGFTQELLIIPVIWCFYQIAQSKLRFAQFIAYIYLVVLLLAIPFEMLKAGTTVISLQLVSSWIMIAELLLVMWVLSFIYDKYKITGRGQRLSEKLHELVYFSPLLFLVLSLIQISNYYDGGFSVLAFDYVWMDFLIIGVLLVVGLKLVDKTEKLLISKSNMPARYVITETLSFYLTTFFLYTAAILFAEWMYNLVVIPMILLLYRAAKKELIFTEILAWSHFVLFALLTFQAYQGLGNLHFSEQSLSTQIAWAEVLISAWLMQSVYERADYKQQGYSIASKLRIGVYLLIPLLFLPRVFRLYTEYVPVFIWLSFAISWLMYKKLALIELLKQLTILYYVAVLTTVLIVFAAISGSYQTAGLSALFAGVLMLVVFHMVEKSFVINRPVNFPSLDCYQSLKASSPYYFVFAIGSFSYAFSDNISLALLTMSLGLLYLTQERRARLLIRNSIMFAYLLSSVGLVVITLLVFLANKSSISLIIIDLLAVISLWYLIHAKLSISVIAQKRYLAADRQYWLFHAVVFIAYSGMLNLLFTDWSVGTSIAMLMHAVIVLFLTLSDRYKALLRLSIVLYAFTAIKVLFHDMNDFSHIHKVIALMCMGSILMLAAYLFQKIRNNRIISTC